MKLTQDEIEKVYSAGITLYPLLRPIESKAQHELLLQWAGQMMSELPDEANHPLNWLLEALADRIEAYENQLYPICPLCKSKRVEILENDTWDFPQGPANLPYQVQGITCFHCLDCGEKWVNPAIDKKNQPLSAKSF
jgi:hypothetical protein